MSKLLLFFILTFPLSQSIFAQTTVNPREYLTQEQIQNIDKNTLSENDGNHGSLAGLVPFAMAIFAARLARRQGRSTFGWFLITLIGIGLPLFVLFLLKPLPTPETHVLCPDCKEHVLKEARVCKSCGCKLIPQA
jgi:hypothetical protein